MGRSPAPPYLNEGPHALWHFSEDPTIQVFHPHTPATAQEPGAFVWAIDTRHAPMFWFPRDCPRGCAWVDDATTPGDRDLLFGQTDADRIHVIEQAWLPEMQACRLYGYRLPAETFDPHSATLKLHVG